MSNEMREIILGQSEQITHSLEVNKNIKVAGTFDSIVLVGMGGSGHPGDLINGLGVAKLPLYVHRNYDLPTNYLKSMGLTKPLIITSSYSGNTEESLTAYQAAQKDNLPLLGSAAGGRLQEWAKRDNIPFCLIDYPGMQPRHTLFAAFTGIYQALRNSELAYDITTDLLRVKEVLTTVTPTLEDLGKELATKIKDKIPVYVSPDSLGFVAKNLKIQTNENAKYPAFWNTFPELNHNELVGFSKLTETDNPNKFIIVMIHDDDAHPRVKARMKVTANLYEKWGADVANVTAEGDTLLEKLFYTTTLGLWTTMHLALAYDIDPVPVPGVEGFKQQLEEIAGGLFDD